MFRGGRVPFFTMFLSVCFVHKLTKWCFVPSLFEGKSASEFSLTLSSCSSCSPFSQAFITPHFVQVS